jgi:transposase-like protein
MRERTHATQEKWRELARQATREEDPEKMLALVERLIEAYDAEKQPMKDPQQLRAAKRQT